MRRFPFSARWRLPMQLLSSCWPSIWSPSIPLHSPRCCRPRRSTPCLHFFFPPLANCHPLALITNVAADGADRVRAPGALSPHPTGDLPLHDGRRHPAGAYLRRRSPRAAHLGACCGWLGCAHALTMACLCPCVFCSQTQELQGRLKKAKIKSGLLPEFRIHRSEAHARDLGLSMCDGAARVRAPGALSPHPRGDLPLHDGHRHPAGV